MNVPDWYNAFANANKDGNITDTEYNSLKGAYDQIVNDAMAKRNELMKTFGWEEVFLIDTCLQVLYILCNQSILFTKIVSKIDWLHKTLVYCNQTN